MFYLILFMITTFKVFQKNLPAETKKKVKENAPDTPQNT